MALENEAHDISLGLWLELDKLDTHALIRVGKMALTRHVQI